MFEVLDQFVMGKKGQLSGGEDRVFVSKEKGLAVVIDGITPKTKAVYDYKGKANCAPGEIAAEILLEAAQDIDPEMDFLETLQFLDSKIFLAYEQYGIVEKVTKNASERIGAVVGVYNDRQKALFMYGEVQARYGDKHFQSVKIVDDLNAAARSERIKELLAAKEITIEEILGLPTDEDPGRKLILAPPLPGANFPGLVGQEMYQNKPGKYGYPAVDGFADPACSGYDKILIPEGTNDLFLATDGYLVAKGFDPVVVLRNRATAEAHREFVLNADPLLYDLYPATKGLAKGLISNDDRGCVHLKLN